MTNTRYLEPADFEGASLQQMRSWVENGSPDDLYDKSKSWETEDKYLQDLKGRVEQALKDAGASMQSASGEAMQNQAMPVVLWTEVTAENAKAQSQLMLDQGDAFVKVKSSIPGKGEEQEVPDDYWFEEAWDSIVNGQTDAEAAKEHNEKLRQEAAAAAALFAGSYTFAMANPTPHQLPLAVVGARDDDALLLDEQAEPDRERPTGVVRGRRRRAVGSLPCAFRAARGVAEPRAHGVEPELVASPGRSLARDVGGRDPLRERSHGHLQLRDHAHPRAVADVGVRDRCRPGHWPGLEPH
ncbi:hypothetical protein [Saccharopolyspora hordei]|uniref:Uncharacterized protein n=1 Tax=Saccharopolyspora hordei TaxID=1838 RepID=A0A853AIU0_9PSEU|nr:hypothetical protein [Saccharopolyspora hordei]NYI83706.1 hypothetical protein [Saccharopolyspora hordei]